MARWFETVRARARSARRALAAATLALRWGLAVSLGLVLALGVGVSACGDASPDRGYDLKLRVANAQVARGAFPVDQGGPKLTFVDVRDPRVGAGDTENNVTGRAASGTFALNIGFEGDPGYWIAPIGLPDDVNPGELQFRVSIDFARSLPPGPVRVLFQAVDGSGRPGPVSVGRFLIENPVPNATLLFSLEWDAQMDVDLVVVDPAGIMIGAKNINSIEPPPPGAPVGGEDDWKRGGILDYDSNANCAIDGRRRENVYWTAPPPSGRYQVYAAVHSTCGLASTSFRARIIFKGQSRSFSDVLYASDGRSQPVAPPLSPGVLITEFDVP